MKLSSITDVTPSKLLYYKSLDYYYTSLSGGTYLLFRLQSWKKSRIFAKEKWKFYELKFIKNEMHFFYENCLLSKNANMALLNPCMAFLFSNTSYITIKEFEYLLTFPACFYIPIIFPIWIIIAITSVNKFLFQRMFWPFTVQTYCSSVLKIFANSQNSASNFKRFSWSLELFFSPRRSEQFWKQNASP